MAVGPLYLADKSTWEQARYDQRDRDRLRELRETAWLAVCLVSLAELLYSAPPRARTCTDPYNLIGEGPRIDNGRSVQVSCKITAPSAPSVGLYWYRIVNPPWDNQYYSPANAFLNGDPAEGPYKHVVDEAVPDCPR